MNFEIKGIDHVVLKTADLERAIGIYCGVLGCQVERQSPEHNLAQLRAGPALIDLRVADRASEADNLEHFCIRIDPFDADLLRAHLELHGATPGEVRQRYGAEGNGASMYITDPDGNTVELKGPSPPA